MGKVISYVVVLLGAVVATWLLVSRCYRSETVPEVQEIRDTVVVTVRDTVELIKPVYVTETVVDTVFVECESGTIHPVVFTQRYYQGDDYEAWVSGYRPSLDTIRVFPVTEYQYITTVKETQAAPRWSLYAGLDGIVTTSTVAPFVSAYVTTPSRLSFSLGVGVMDRDVAYKIGIGYKIF